MIAKEFPGALKIHGPEGSFAMGGAVGPPVLKYADGSTVY
jgi:hypothetical protein